MTIFHFSIKSGKKGTASEHARYIAREGKHSMNDEQTDLVVTQCGNLPVWSNGNPFKLWNAADKYERSNGSAYRELEIALPNILTTDQQLEIVESLIKDHVGTKPYQFALHAPSASIEGVSQPHLHLMLSDRLDDGIERDPEQFFKRYNTANPERGGSKKDSGGKEPRVLKEQLITLRKNVANTINSELEKNGHKMRVDHRSHWDRGIKKEPEKHLGQGTIKNMSAEEKESIKKNRKVNSTKPCTE
jgi:hypothetical protein